MNFFVVLMFGGYTKKLRLVSAVSLDSRRVGMVTHYVIGTYLSYLSSCMDQDSDFTCITGSMCIYKYTYRCLRIHTNIYIYTCICIFVNMYTYMILTIYIYRLLCRCLRFATWTILSCCIPAWSHPVATPRLQFYTQHLGSGRMQFPLTSCEAKIVSPKLSSTYIYIYIYIYIYTYIPTRWGP